MNLRRFFRKLSNLELIDTYNPARYSDSVSHGLLDVTTLTMRGLRTRRRPVATEGRNEWRFADTGEHIEEGPMEALVFAAKAQRDLVNRVADRFDADRAEAQKANAGSVVTSVYGGGGGGAGVSNAGMGLLGSQGYKSNTAVGKELQLSRDQREEMLRQLQAAKPNDWPAQVAKIFN